MASCNGTKKKNGLVEQSDPSAQSAGGPNTVTDTQTPPETEPLPQESLGKFSQTCVLVQGPGKTNLPGVVIGQKRSKTNGSEFLVICNVPENPDSIRVAFTTRNGLEVAPAKKIISLPSGLSIYGFVSRFSAYFKHKDKDNHVAGQTFHVLRITSEGTLNEEKRSAHTKEISTIQERQKQNQNKLANAKNQLANQFRAAQNTGGSSQKYEIQQEIRKITTNSSQLSQEESCLNDILQFPIDSIVFKETFASETRENLEKHSPNLDGTLLVTSSCDVQAIRHQGKWLDLNDAIAAVSNQVEGMSLSVSNQQNNVQLSCHLSSIMPLPGNTYSMVTATTFELESLGSGTVEERLARITPVPFLGTATEWMASRTIPWNKQDTTLWLKVFNDKNPEKPVIDDIILLSWSDTLYCKWGKPPSPLITQPEPVANSPEDLVKEQVVLDAGGGIRDIIAAGDGSIVMVQTNAAPYWAQLDLKTGKWTNPPWKATADTLLATQAGKIYLIDRKSRVLDIRDTASGARLGMQLLPGNGDIAAAAAPLLDPNQPLVIASEKNLILLDPKKFEIIPNDINLDSIFSGNQYTNAPKTIDPTSIKLRASHDGVFYSIDRTASLGPNKEIQGARLTVDHSSLVLSIFNDYKMIPSRGRHTTSYFPDHGGTGIEVRVSKSSNHFPGPSGQIQFTGGTNQSEYASLNNPPCIPTKSSRTDGLPLPDRGIYFDSRNHVLLIPDADKLHLIRVNVPEAEPMLPDLVMPGEEVEIPLPSGNAHQLVSKIDGQISIGKSSAKWTVPDKLGNQMSNQLKLEWTGELGTKIDKSYQITTIQPPPTPMIESPDGSKKRPLVRRGVIRKLPEMRTYAGSGNVTLAFDGNTCDAWNLLTCEKIHHLVDKAFVFFGDADRIYSVGAQGKLTSYDLLTGSVLGAEEIGTSSSALHLFTGMASRLPLLAIESDNRGNEFVMNINRDTLKSTILEMPPDQSMSIPRDNYLTNASGSAAWSSGTLIIRNNNQTKITTFDLSIGIPSNARPDASGRFLVGNDVFFDMNQKPLKKIQAPATMPGVPGRLRWRLDESGRYLMVFVGENGADYNIVSIRELSDPSRELFKLRNESSMERGCNILSDAKIVTIGLTYNSQPMTGVYDFDIPAIIQEFSR